MIALVTGANREIEALDILVNAICPGWTDTDMGQGGRPVAQASTERRVGRRARRRRPDRRLLPRRPPAQLVSRTRGSSAASTTSAIAFETTTRIDATITIACSTGKLRLSIALGISR